MIRSSDCGKNLAGRMKRSAMKWSKGMAKSVDLDAFILHMKHQM